MLPHESPSSSSFSSSSFLPSSSTSSSAEITEPEPVIKVEDESQFNSATVVEYDVRVKVEDELDKQKQKEENVFQHLSQLLNEPDAECTNKNGTVVEPQNVELVFQLKEEQNIINTNVIPSKTRFSSCGNQIPGSTQIQSNCDNRVAKEQNTFYKVYKCDWCVYKTNHEYHLKAHLRTHKSIKSIKSSSSPTNKIRFPCHLCSVTTTKKPYLKRHIQNVHAETRLFKCSELGCEYSTNKKSNLKLHGFSRHGKGDDLEILACSLCPYKTPHNKNLQEHVNGVHTRLFKFACDLCPYETCWKSNLQKHVNCVHLNLRPYKCPQTGCDYVAKEYVAFKEHMKRCHKKSQEEIKNMWKTIFRSSNPNNSSAVQVPESTSQLELKLSTKTRPTSKIPVCSENVQSNFDTKFTLYETENRKLSEGKDNNNNDNNKRKNKNKSNNINGSKSKLKNRLIYCPYCTCKYLLKDNFEAHLRTHKSKKKIRFRCHLCSVALTREANLERHIQNVHSSPFKCLESGCDYTVKKTRKNDIRIHLENRHFKSRQEIETILKDIVSSSSSSPFASASAYQAPELESKSESPTQKLVTTTTSNPTCTNFTSPILVSTQSNCANFPDQQKMFYKVDKCDCCDYKTNHEYHLKAHVRTHKSIKSVESSSSPTKKKDSLVISVL